MSIIQCEEYIFGKVGVLLVSTQKNKGTISKYTENWLPIRNIINGAIVLDNGYQVTGIKIQPKNIFILDYQTQDNTIFNLRNFYNQIDYEFWLIITDRPVDVNLYLSQLQIQFNSVQSPVKRKMIMEDIDKARLFSEKDLNVTDTEYFILFKEKKPEIIQKRIQQLISGLAQAGLQATQTTNSDLRVMLDGILNGGPSTEFGTVIAQ